MVSRWLFLEQLAALDSLCKYRHRLMDNPAEVCFAEVSRDVESLDSSASIVLYMAQLFKDIPLKL